MADPRNGGPSEWRPSEWRADTKKSQKICNRKSCIVLPVAEKAVYIDCHRASILRLNYVVRLVVLHFFHYFVYSGVRMTKFGRSKPLPSTVSGNKHVKSQVRSYNRFGAVRI